MSDNHFPTIYQSFIHKSRYARYIDSKKRREDWAETVARYFDFFEEHLKENNDFDIEANRKDLEEAVLSQQVMPSMRALMTAGKALHRDHVAGYNCAYQPMDSLKSFDEELFILMCGTGDGYSVEEVSVSKLPEIADEFHTSDTTIVFEDSKLGWAKGYREYLTLLIAGQVPKYDTSKLRPSGARLKTFGGRSSGPEPLVELLKFTEALFRKAAGRKLTTVEAHDLACFVASIVVVGGVRRSALISLSDLQDARMRDAKSGQWWDATPYRRLANNSALYHEKPEVGVFMKEWLSIYESKSGERGIFSRGAAKHIVQRANDFRLQNFSDELLDSTVKLRDIDHDFGTNPCSEIILRPYEFCNLSEVIVRPTDDLASLKRKVELATILGTFQSTLTKFRYLNKKWQKNCEEERLLGVSLTGIYDNKLLCGAEGTEALETTLTELRKVAIATNAKWAKLLGINPSAAITCVKPSGTVSALNNTASGIHTRHSPYYFRYVRNDIKDPVTQFMKDSGVPWEKDVYDPNNMVAFKFPMKAPEGVPTRGDITAIAHLELWKTYQLFWCDHKPSVTITVKEHEWPSVGAWVFNNFDIMSGVSFLPSSDHVYRQAPYTDCSKEEYEELLKIMPKTLDWTKLATYEKEDATTSSQELACVAGGCEI